MQRRGGSSDRGGGGEIVLTIEHRCAPAPEPIALRLDDRDQKAVHLAIAGGSGRGHPTSEESSSARPAATATPDFEATVIAAIVAAHPVALTGAALRSRLWLRNQRLGEVLTALEADGRIRHGEEGWGLVVAAKPSSDDSL